MGDRELENISVPASIPEWSIIVDNTTAQTPTPNNKRNSKKKKMMKKGIREMWNEIFLLVCVIAVSLDPLFFYIPTINDDDKCLKMNKKLISSALVLRSLTDMVYLIDVGFNMVKAYESLKREESLVGKKGQLVKTALAVAPRLSWSLVVVDLLSILPIPQVGILVFLERVMPASGSLSQRWLNMFVLSQYVPRVLRIYLSCIVLTRTQDELTRILWVKGGFNFFLYILASHVFGGFWYFFSFQRVTSCWHRAICLDEYKNDQICANGIHSCDIISDSRANITILLNEKCPINPPNATAFDFGIFLQALESGVHSSDDFFQKFLNCFWWGLQNLSSFGQNLQPSNYTWEICFAVSISIVGLLLFLYLIGNMQTYIQLATTRSEEIGEKMKLKERDIEVWIAKNGLPKEMKTSIMQKVKHKLEENYNKDVDVGNLLSILPSEDRKSIKRLLCLPMLKQIPMFRNMNDQVLKEICDNLKPVIYNESSYMIQERDPLDRMLFITQGTAWAYKTIHYNHHDHDQSDSNNGIASTSMTSTSSSTRRLKKHDYFGEELLQWSLTHNTITDFPISTTNVKSHTKVEAFAFMANDLLNLVSRFWWHFRRNLPSDSTEFHAKRWEILSLAAVRAFRRRIEKKRRLKNSSPAPQLADIREGRQRVQKLNYQRLHHN